MDHRQGLNDSMARGLDRSTVGRHEEVDHAKGKQNMSVESSQDDAEMCRENFSDSLAED